MEITLSVTLQIDPNEVGDSRFSDKQLQQAGLEAVKNSLDFFVTNGFEHAMADDVSVGVADVSILPSNPQTINVVITRKDQIEESLDIYSFTDTEEGKRQAEEKFVSLVKEIDPNIHEDDVEIALEDGCHRNKSFAVIITYSNMGE